MHLSNVPRDCDARFKISSDAVRPAVCLTKAAAMKKMSVDARFQTGATHLIAGSPGSGKTYSVMEILRNVKDMFVDGEKIKNVVFYYASWQEMYDRLDETGVVTEWVPRMPTNDEFVQAVAPYRTGGGSIVVIDDFMSEISKELVDIVTVSARHNNASTFILFQSLFPTDREARQISLSVKYIWVFKNPRENSQFGHLVRQITPRDYKWMVDAFQEATRDAYTYVLLDLTQTTPDHLRIRSAVLPSQAPMKVWMRKGDPHLRWTPARHGDSS